MLIHLKNYEYKYSNDAEQKKLIQISDASH